jgi:ADP-ribose pyrophosphatase
MSGSPDSSLPGLPQRWEVLATHPHAECRVFKVQRKTCRHPSRERPADFFVIDSADWVNVLALTPAGELVLVSQYRFGIDAVSLEIPGGVMDPGEDPLVAGQRELLEETGFAGGRATLLGSVHPNPAIQNNRCHLVLVEAASPAGELAWDEHEELATTLAPVDQVFRWAREGRITHSLVLNALLLFEPIWRSMSAGNR